MLFMSFTARMEDEDPSPRLHTCLLLWHGVFGVLALPVNYSVTSFSDY